MSRSKTHTRQNRALNSLLEKGIAAVVFGIAFLMAPLFFGASPILQPVANGLRPVGWPVLGLGLLLLGLHLALQRRTAKAPVQNSSHQAPQRRAADNHPDVFGKVPMPAPGTTPRHASAPQAPTVTPPATTWSPAVFAAIEWRRFEAVCEALFAQAGFETRSQSHGADGGVDIWLHSHNAEGPVAVVQCKHWQGKPVGVKEMREFLGVMTAHQLRRGTYATTSSYTSDALQFAKDNRISAMDGKALLGLIAKRTPEQQQALLAVAYEGEYWRPTCASCGVKMVARTAAKDDSAFWGCSNYPRCKRTLPMAAPK